MPKKDVESCYNKFGNKDDECIKCSCFLDCVKDGFNKSILNNVDSAKHLYDLIKNLYEYNRESEIRDLLSSPLITNCDEKDLISVFKLLKEIELDNECDVVSALLKNHAIINFSGLIMMLLRSGEFYFNRARKEQKKK